MSVSVLGTRLGLLNVEGDRSVVTFLRRPSPIRWLAFRELSDCSLPFDFRSILSACLGLEDVISFPSALVFVPCLPGVHTGSAALPFP